MPSRAFQSFGQTPDDYWADPFFAAQGATPLPNQPGRFGYKTIQTPGGFGAAGSGGGQGGGAAAQTTQNVSTPSAVNNPTQPAPNPPNGDSTTPPANTFGGFMSSPGGYALINAAGGLLQGIGQSKSDAATRAVQANEYMASLRQNQYQFDKNFRAQQGESVLNQDPLGADQQYAQKQALMNAILPNLRNVHSQPGDAGVAAAMGGNRGGMMNALGPNGLDPEMINAMFGPQSTMDAISTRRRELLNVDPNAPMTNLNNMYGDQANPFMKNITDWATRNQQQDATSRDTYNKQMDALYSAILGVVR